MDAIADYLGLDRADVRSANFILPERDALRPRAALPGRPAAELRLGRLPGQPRQAQEARRLGRLRGLPRRGGEPGPAGRARHRLLRRGHRRRPLRGRPHPDRDLRPGQRLHRPDHPGAGPPDRVRADRRRGARRAARRTSTSPPATPAGSAYCRGHVRLPRRRDERQRGGAGGPQGPREGAADRRRGPRGRPGRPRDRRRRRARQGRPRGLDRAVGTVSVLSNPLRYAFDEAAKVATQFAGNTDLVQAAGRRGRGARAGGQGLLLPAPGDVRQRHARGDRRDRPRDGRDHDPALLRHPRLRHA